MLALCKSCFGAVRRYCLVYNLGVSERINGFLCYKNCVTYRAVLSLGKTRFGTGRLHCLIYNLGVSESVNNLLCYKHFFTDGAVLAFSKSCFGTVRRYCLIYNLGVSESVGVVTHVAIATMTGIGSISALGTGRLGNLFCVAVTSRCKHFAITVVAIYTSVDLFSSFCTGRLFSHRADEAVLTILLSAAGYQSQERKGENE